MIVEAILEAIEKADEAADEVIETEETFVELIGEAILEAVERVETVRGKIAGEGEAVRDKNAEEGEAILEAAERVEEFTVDPSVEAVLRPRNELRNLLSNHLPKLYLRLLKSRGCTCGRRKKSKDPGSNPGRSKTLECL